MGISRMERLWWVPWPFLDDDQGVKKHGDARKPAQVSADFWSSFTSRGALGILSYMGSL